MKDRFISLNETGHDNPYNDSDLLRFEDIFGYLMTYKFPFGYNDVKSIKNYRRQLKKTICDNCVRLKDPPVVTKRIKQINPVASKANKRPIYTVSSRGIFANCNGCRVLELKKSMTAILKLDKQGILFDIYMYLDNTMGQMSGGKHYTKWNPITRPKLAR